MPDPQFLPFMGFENPMQVVDRTDLAYEVRLAVLQEWQARLAQSGSDEDRRNAVLGAIHALEMGAEVQDDAPEDAPEHFGYGKPGP